jgi:hypothetical protein
MVIRSVIPLQYHHGKVVRPIGYPLLAPRNANYLIETITVYITNTGRRVGPLKPHGPAGTRPFALVEMIVIILHFSIPVTDKLPPAHWLIFTFTPPASIVGGISEQSRAVGIKCLDVMVIIGYQDLFVVIVINITDTHIQAIGAKATVPVTVGV